MIDEQRNTAQPGTGLSGLMDRFLGPETTHVELILEIIAGMGATVFVLLWAALGEAGWSAAQYLVAAIITLDVAGGAVANATVATKRWYHRPGQGFTQHMAFLAPHVVHLLLVAWFFRGEQWSWAAAFYIYLMLAASIILRSPLYFRRPVAVLLFLGALLLDQYTFGPTVGLGWFIPAFFLKLLIGHLLPETAVPESESTAIPSLKEGS